MDKKDIYEHLAEIYLDASSKTTKKKRKGKKYPSFLNPQVSLAAISVFLLVGLLFVASHKKYLNREISLVLCADAVKINFHFDPAEKEIFTLNLKELNLSAFRTLGFSLKKLNSKDTITLRVEFISRFKEKSEVYLRDIQSKWQDYKIDLAEFKQIKDWSQINSLSFIVESWNTKEKKGIVYVDSVRLLR